MTSGPARPRRDDPGSARARREVPRLDLAIDDFLNFNEAHGRRHGKVPTTLPRRPDVPDWRNLRRETVRPQPGDAMRHRNRRHVLRY